MLCHKKLEKMPKAQHKSALAMKANTHPDLASNNMVCPGAEDL